MGDYVDLHIHSCYSDGLFNPKTLIETAKKNNVGILSITDHDTVDGIHDIDFDDKEVEIITGIELSSFIDIKGNKKKIHLLGYDFDYSNSELQDVLMYLKEYRTKINLEYLYQLKKMYSCLRDDMYCGIDYSKYCRLWKEIETYMKRSGYTVSEIEDVKKYTINNFPEYPDYDIFYKDVISAIRKAGGDVILAHPFSYKLNDEDVLQMIYTLLDAGADGIEAYYSEYSSSQIQRLVHLAKALDISYTCGSDHHFPTVQNNKEIGYGIDNNLCQEDCSYLQKRLRKERNNL